MNKKSNDISSWLYSDNAGLPSYYETDWSGVLCFDGANPFILKGVQTEDRIKVDSCGRKLFYSDLITCLKYLDNIPYWIPNMDVGKLTRLSDQSLKYDYYIPEPEFAGVVVQTPTEDGMMIVFNNITRKIKE